MAIPFSSKWTYELMTEEEIEKTYGNYDIYTLELCEAHLKRLVEYHRISGKKWHLKSAEFELLVVSNLIENRKILTPPDKYGSFSKPDPWDLSEEALGKHKPWDVLPDVFLRW